MGLIAPNLLETADVDQLAALAAPNRLVIAGGVNATGKPARMDEAFAFTRSVYKTLKATPRLTVLDSTDLAGFVRTFAAG